MLSLNDIISPLKDEIAPLTHMWKASDILT